MLLKVLAKRMYCLLLLLFFNHGPKFQKSVCNGCHDLLMFCLNIIDITIINIKGTDYLCIIHDIRKYVAIYLLHNSLLDNCGYI